jgi:hypothetical protein
MSNWSRSNVTTSVLHRLAAAGQLPALSNTQAWRVPKDKSVPRPSKGYIVSLVVFHERDFSIPTG